MKLHLGCGQIIKPGWENLDLEPGAGGRSVDLTKPLPYPSGTVEAVFSEHFIEHITQEQGKALLRECHRVLIPGKWVRVSTPNLYVLAKDYLYDNTSRWQQTGWEPMTPAELLNQGMRFWGHQYLYDARELTRAFHRAGFTNVRLVEWRKSQLDELNELEARTFLDDLIMEAQKP